MKCGSVGSFEVLSVNVSSVKGVAKGSVPFIDLDGLGVVGDAHRGTPDRQVSLLDRTAVDRMEAETDGLVILPGAMGENITFRRLSSVEFSIGDLITFNEVVLRIDHIGKECHGEGCAIFRAVGECVMPSEGLFCTVVSPGRIIPGDVAEVLRSVN